MMSEGNLIAPELVSKMEKSFSPFPSAEKTGILPIFRTVCPLSDLGELDVKRKPPLLK